MTESEMQVRGFLLNHVFFKSIRKTAFFAQLPVDESKLQSWRAGRDDFLQWQKVSLILQWEMKAAPPVFSKISLKKEH